MTPLAAQISQNLTLQKGSIWPSRCELVRLLGVNFPAMSKSGHILRAAQSDKICHAGKGLQIYTHIRGRFGSDGPHSARLVGVKFATLATIAPALLPNLPT